MSKSSQRTPFLLILAGLPSSGKTSLARKLAEMLEGHGVATATVSSDDFRDMVSARQADFDPSREPFVSEAFHSATELAVKNGFFTIVDDMNYYESTRKRLKDIALKHRIGYAIIHLNVSPAVAKEWNVARGEPIPNSLIDDIAMRFDLPGKKYAWDRPLMTTDLSNGSLDQIATRCLEACREKLKLLPPTVVKSRSVQVKGKRGAEIERMTRRALGEIMERYHPLEVGYELSEVRKRIVREAMDGDLAAEDAVKQFIAEAEGLIHVSRASPVGRRTVIHVGLFGHVDHGKTTLAARLTTKPSTASLDKHPEAQRRGMTIDIGFSAFNMNGFLVTLVDLPGHYSLIRHAMAGASIIDVAILLVAADEGPNVQTYEHLSILKGVSVDKLVVVLNKMDLVSRERLVEVKGQVQSILRDTKFENSPIVEISAAKSLGLEDLKKAILSVVKPPLRQWVGSLRIPIDHAFHVGGAGTVVTGTILTGTVKRGDEVEVAPLGKRCKVRLIQTFGEEVEEASAGDRVGIAISDIRPDELKRGFVLAAPASIKSTRAVDAEITVDQNFSSELMPKTRAHISLGLASTTGTLTPYSLEDGRKVVLDRVSPGRKALCHITLQTAIPVDKEDETILFKFDMPPKSSRIIGTGEVVEVETESSTFYRKKIRTGKVVKKISPDTVVADGLFASREAASRYIGQKVYISDKEGKIKEYTGDGKLILQVGSTVNEGMDVNLPIYRQTKV